MILHQYCFNFNFITECENKEDQGAKSCYSILVETGVYSGSKDQNMALNHSQRDFLSVEDIYKEPTIIVSDCAKAVDAIYEREKFD